MTASISPAAQAIIDTGRTQVTAVLRFAPRFGAVFGLCQTNVDLTLDDGQGAVTYVAAVGFDRSAIASTSGQQVDNAEARAIQSQYASLGISADMVNSGYLDGARFWMYLVDAGSLQIIRLMHYGYVGETRTEGKQIVVPELVSLSQMTRQKSLCQAGSKTCRATWADASTGCAGTKTTGTGTVLALAGESDREFTTAATLPTPGIVTFTSGANTGRTLEVESFAAGKATLMLFTPYPIEPGATFTWANQCDKRWTTCKTLLGALAPGSFRGEPWRLESVGDGLKTPGATV